MPNNDYDDLFNAWGEKLNVDPQLAKTVFHIESNGDPNAPDGPESPNAPIDPVTGKRERAQGGMQILPSTARALATRMGFDPSQVDLHDMRWAVPLGMAYLADGANATNGDTAGTVAYYFAGPDRSKWGPKTRAYVQQANDLYPTMGAPAGGDQPGPATEPPIGAGPKAVAPWLRANGQSLDPTKLNWCGAYTAAALNAAGLPTLPEKEGRIATNWATYGTPITTEPLQPNDVIVLPGRSAIGALGGHVGVATGESRYNPKTGVAELQMRSGNAHNGIVSVDWVPASQVIVRRGVAPQQQQPDAAPSPAPSPVAPAPNPIHATGY